MARQKLDLNLTEIFRRGLKRAVHEQMPTNLNELKKHCKERALKFLSNVTDESFKSHTENPCQLVAVKCVQRAVESWGVFHESRKESCEKFHMCMCGSQVW